MAKARIIALYLPQFHPIPENDKNWGKGFTEWTNVVQSKPLFRHHYQPRIPADLGFYDLRLAETRIKQAEYAKNAGIEGFCYWHYWFGNGKEVLQKPLDEVVKTGEPSFPFCLGWALHDWTTKTWDKNKKAGNKIIFKQEFPGEEDDISHFNRLLPMFKDERYIKVDGKLLFNILCPHLLPDPQKFIKLWNRLAIENGLNGFHFVGIIESMPIINSKNIKNINETVEKNIEKMKQMGFDAVQTTNQKYAEIKYRWKIAKVFFAILRRILPGLIVEKYNYKRIIKEFYSPSDKREDVYPQLLVGWDRSPRSGRRAIIYHMDTPENFRYAVQEALKVVENKKEEHKIIFLNSWNEWGEGAYLEPDLKYGDAKLKILKELINE